MMCATLLSVCLSIHTYTAVVSRAHNTRFAWGESEWLRLAPSHRARGGCVFVQVISDADRAAGMLRDFPDPRFVLGPIYTD